MKKRLLLLAAALIVAMTGSSRLSANTGPNGTNPRPFYVMAHNPNTLDMVTLALASGANALEPDIMVLPDDAVGLPFFQPDPPGMVMYHDSSSLTARVPLTLEEWCDGVNLLVRTLYPNQLALVEFDVKTPAAKRANGPKILDAINNHLNANGVNLNVIISVGNRVPDGQLFTDIYPLLGERIGVQVDAEDDPQKVVEFLEPAANGNIAYGDGTLGPGPHLLRAVDWGSFLKASWGLPKSISDVYTVADIGMMDWFIDAGADGIIPDHFVNPLPLPGLAETEFDLLSPPFLFFLEGRFAWHPEIRYATPDDNPFKPDVQAYGLEVRTGADGTDAQLTFTLEGCRGSADVTVHTGIAPNLTGTGRMESGNTDHVTIRSLNLGKLTKLTIENHGGAANFPDWDLQEVAVSSAVYLGNDRNHEFEYRATFNGTIEGGTTKPLDLTPFFDEPLATIECPAPITVNNDPGKCNAVVAFAPKVDGMCPGVTAVSTPPSGTAFGVGANNVTSYAQYKNVQSPACMFSVTVKDVEGPQISCPAPMTVDATGPQGAAVSFAPVAATDNCSATVASAPASGSVFAIGTTTVDSTAQDPSGNAASCSFTVHVKGAAEQLGDLITAVNGTSMKDGTRSGLLAKLNAALANLANKTSTACGPLGDFINLVQAHQGKDIVAAAGDALIEKATQIRTVIGC
jgi:HYR domain